MVARRELAARMGIREERLLRLIGMIQTAMRVFVARERFRRHQNEHFVAQKMQQLDASLSAARESMEKVADSLPHDYTYQPRLVAEQQQEQQEEDDDEQQQQQ